MEMEESIMDIPLLQVCRVVDNMSEVVQRMMFIMMKLPLRCGTLMSMVVVVFPTGTITFNTGSQSFSFDLGWGKLE